MSSVNLAVYKKANRHESSGKIIADKDNITLFQSFTGEKGIRLHFSRGQALPHDEMSDGSSVPCLPGSLRSS